jgi:uncharacterized SAM-binding protein YcdF (DUF218 family)
MREIIFAVQNIVLGLFFPISVCLCLCILGILLWRRRRLSFVLIAAGVAWLLIMSFPLVSLNFIQSLESRAGSYADPGELSTRGVKHIVVLSGGFREGHLTPADKLSCSVLRLIEGVRLWRGIPDCTLVLTGGMIPGLSTDASVSGQMERMALEMGVPKEAIKIESESWRTEDQARLVSGMVKNHPFALVTSAYHMPRAVFIFQGMGLSPISAACDFQATKISVDYTTLLPGGEALMLSQTATREYLAWACAAVKQRLAGNGS